MKVSIVTVVYNNVETIESAIASVRSQDYPDIEYIVIDGNSSDGTKEVLLRNNDVIDVLISEPDQGIYDAMNKGVSKASGDIIAILNSDDLFWDNKVISDVVQSFKSNPESQIVYGNIAYVRKGEEDTIVRLWKSRKYYPRFFEDGHVPPHTGFYVRKECYQLGGLFKVELKLAADYDLMFRFMKIKGFKSDYVDRNMVRMRLGGATNQSMSNIIDGNKEIISTWHYYGIRPPLFFMMKKVWHRLVQFRSDG